MSEYYARRGSNSKSCFTFVILLIFSSLSSIVMAPSAEASTSGNLAIVNSVNPQEDTWLPAYDSITFSVTIENLHHSPSPPGRVLNWYACEGVKVANVCITSSVDDGSITINSIFPATSEIIESTTYFNPNGFEGNMTIVYQFDQFDLNPSNDIYTFTINSTLEYSDIKLAENVDIIDQLSNLATYDNKSIINSNNTYSFNFEGFAHLCGICQINATIGWQLWNLELTEMISEAQLNYSSFPQYGYYRSFTTPLPVFSHNSTGQFNLKYGMFHSNGSPHGDMVAENHLSQITLIIDDEIDLVVNSMHPTHNSISPVYYFGENMVSAKITNDGNLSVHNTNITMEIYDAQGENIDSDICLIETLNPGTWFVCQFDIMTSGSELDLKISIPVNLQEGNDSFTGNNIILENTEIIIPPLSGYIINNNPKGWYTTQDEINLTGNANLYAPGPINYSWWYLGIMNLGYEQNLIFNSSTIGLGEHMIRLTVRDIFGNSENIFHTINIYYYAEKDNSPQFIASSVTTVEAMIETENMLPLVGETYGVGNGKSPLLLISFELSSENSNQSLFTGANWMDIELNSSFLLPSSIPFESVEVRKLNSLNDTTWESLNSLDVNYNNDEENITIRIFESITLLIIGQMNTPNVEAINFTASLAQGGKFNLNWIPSGEIESNYINGWNIYQLIVPPNGGTVFPSQNENFSQLIWDDLTQDSFKVFLPITANDWKDPLVVSGTDYCSSYAIVPVDRQGYVHFEKANVTTDENGDGTYLCGDNTPPSSTVNQFNHNWEFTNSTDCFKIENDWSICYQVNLTWIWPEHESDGNITWNLYRIEQNPDNIDLSLIVPIQFNIEATPQEIGNYADNGWDQNGIRPERTYYYILTPIDEVGNEKSLIEYPSDNVERVHIEDDWWSYYQHLIPEPPKIEDPPLGSEWLGNISESLELDEFKIAGIVLLTTLCMSMIILPLMLKKRKRLRRIIDARNRQQMTDSMADEFDDFFS